MFYKSIYHFAEGEFRGIERACHSEFIASYLLECCSTNQAVFELLSKPAITRFASAEALDKTKNLQKPGQSGLIKADLCEDCIIDVSDAIFFYDGDSWLYSSRPDIGSLDHSESRLPPFSEFQPLVELYPPMHDPRVPALAKHLDVDNGCIYKWSPDSFEVSGKQFLVLTDNEADLAFDLKFQCPFEGSAPKHLFDRLPALVEFTKQKAEMRATGRGNVLATYDGIERKLEGFYIYRIA